MKDYIEEVIEDFGEDVTKKVATPAARWLFNSGHSRKLPSKKAERFTSIVAKLLWVCQRGRPDCMPSIAYLCTRMKEPTVED